MSVIPEVILHRVLVNGLRAVRKDTRVLDALFRNLDQQTLQAMKDFVTKESIHLTLNYPRTGELHTPAISILLKSENESQGFLGDIIGIPSEMPDQELAIDTLGSHAASVSTISGLPKKVLGPLTVATADYDSSLERTTVVFDSDGITELTAFVQNATPACDAYVVGGAGAGQVGRIINFRPTGLDIDGRFDPQLDNSSLIDIRLVDDSELAVGEPSRVYPVNANNLLRKGAHYDVQYQLSIIAGHQDEVLYLYTIVKALLFAQRAHMESQGLQVLKISGSDFAPRTDYLPVEVFQRVMNLNFTYAFSYIEEIEVFNQIQVQIEPEDAITGELCVPLTFDILIE